MEFGPNGPFSGLRLTRVFLECNLIPLRHFASIMEQYPIYSWVCFESGKMRYGKNAYKMYDIHIYLHICFENQWEIGYVLELINEMMNPSLLV